MPGTDTTPEISQEAARAMLAALRRAEQTLSAMLVFGSVRDLLEKCELSNAAHRDRNAARAAIAQAEGRAP